MTVTTLPADTNATQGQGYIGPWRITFDTNPDDCNLRCIMCEDHSPYSSTQSDRRAAGLPKRRMDVDLIRRTLADAAGNGLREIIPSTMGEPLLYRHIDEIIDLCSQYGVKLNLTTNGTFPRRGATAWAERIVPVGSDVKVSWNGATGETQERVMLGSNWERVVSNVRDFIAVRDAHAANGGNRCRVTFQLTFMEVNYVELPAVVELAAELGVDRVKGHHLWVHAPQPGRHRAVESNGVRRLQSGGAASSARWRSSIAGKHIYAGRSRRREHRSRRRVSIPGPRGVGGIGRAVQSVLRSRRAAAHAGRLRESP